MQVMLVSAQEALLARLVLLDRATEEDRRKFCVKAWGSSWARRKQVKSEAEMQEQAAQMLEDSRLPEMENRLFSFLYKNAGGLKLVSLLDNMGRLLNEVFLLSRLSSSDASFSCTQSYCILSYSSAIQESDMRTWVLTCLLQDLQYPQVLPKAPPAFQMPN